MSEAPDPRDPAALAAYRADWHRMTALPHKLGMMLAVAGFIVALLRLWQPGIPRVVPIVLIVTALGLMALGIVRRSRYHLQRMRRLG